MTLAHAELVDAVLNRGVTDIALVGNRPAAALVAQWLNRHRGDLGPNGAMFNLTLTGAGVFPVTASRAVRQASLATGVSTTSNPTGPVTTSMSLPSLFSKRKTSLSPVPELGRPQREAK